MTSLFSEIESPAPGGARTFAKVAIERSLDRTLDYEVPKALAGAVQVGQRVRVPLGRRNKPAHGYVVALSGAADHATTKPIFGIDDERVLITPRLLELAMWMSRYYCTPLGTVIESVIPSAVKKKVGLDYTQVVRLAQSREATQALVEKIKAPKRRAILGRMLQLDEGQGIDLVKLAGGADVTPPTVRKLARLGLISITPEPDWGAMQLVPVAPQSGAEAVPDLNEDQARVMDELGPRVVAGGFSVNLLLGVTGSGKTEVYLRCIERVIEQGRQAIVLVPEIALTPQTARRFTARFGRVAVLHSGLGAGQRHRYWQQIWQGQADVVVGARSAVFAPLPRLGIIVVDEEHESSYKQDTAPRYHGRDVAIKRAQLEGVPVVLGSATPSLESYWRAKKSDGGGERQCGDVGVWGYGGKERSGADPKSAISDPKSGSCSPPSLDFSSPNPQSAIRNPQLPPLQSKIQIPNSKITSHLLHLPRRVRGLSLPAVELIDMKQEIRARRGVHLLSRRLEAMLRATVDKQQQAILLLNRRGYSNFVYCPSCQNAISCKYCDVTMTYHRTSGLHVGSAKLAEGLHTGQLHCHYCLAVNPLPEKCPVCGKTPTLFGLGTQRVEEELARKFPALRFARVDSDSMHSARDYESLLARFAAREIDVMLGTQMIAKGLDYPNVTLVGVISGDTALSLPDFRAAERTFQLITQVAGRAGRGDAAGRVLVQTFQCDDPMIRAAMAQDYAGFARRELHNRHEVGLPPFTRMVRIVLRDQDEKKLQSRAQDLADLLIPAAAAVGDIRVRGPMACAITRIAGYSRMQVLMTSPSAAALQRALEVVRGKGGFATSDRIAVDVDPVSLL